ncbi:hypothetical protein glysoja_037887 [Glycine soja]|uniref:DUF7812 domain-containing protein n=1 Tax=Glycine soja TaxID=3848 RepID=A0A0B2SI77_GLYSO|nr:hypothetical protein glysoja_037887 [Glycine soja]
MDDAKKLYESLFDQLNSTFRRFFSALPQRHHDPYARSLRPPPPPPHPRLWPIVQELSLVLRSCLLLLTLPRSDQKFLLLKCRFLLRVLKSFLSLDVAEPFSPALTWSFLILAVRIYARCLR